jgi:hypothetical protein
MARLYERSKLSDCAFSLVDLPKGVSVADFHRQVRPSGCIETRRRWR